MKYIKYSLLAIFLFAPMIWAQQEARELADSNWGANVEPSVAKKGFSKDAARDLIRAMANSFIKDKNFLEPEIYEVSVNDLGWDEVIEDYKIPGMLGTVGALKWADVDSDGIYELIVTMDYSGRAFYNNLYIIKQIAGRYRRQRIAINSTLTFIESLDELRNSAQVPYATLDRRFAVLVSDLDHDGTQELLLPILLGSHRGASPVPIWPSIHKWEGYGYTEADNRFASVYEKTFLPGIDEEIRALSKGRSEAEQELDEELAAECVIKDKIIRFLGIDPQAGLQRAIRWTKSANLNLRLNAAITLSEIPGDEAARYLNELNLDPIFLQHILKKQREKKVNNP